LAFSSAWLCQDRALSRVVRSCWTWACAKVTLHRYNLHRSQILTRLLQCLISRQERCPHHVDRRGALRSLCSLVQELVLHDL
jgi:hypothetical protein